MTPLERKIWSDLRLGESDMVWIQALARIYSHPWRDPVESLRKIQAILRQLGL